MPAVLLPAPVGEPVFLETMFNLKAGNLTPGQFTVGDFTNIQKVVIIMQKSV